MIATARTAWTEALRSGRYEPDMVFLRSLDNKYCPLGILADVYCKALGRDLWIKSAAEGGYALHGNLYTLPRQVKEWAGFNDLECPWTVPICRDGKLLWYKFSHDNLTLPEVARLVEENF